ncbi:COP9 signalosome complex subunit 1b [Camponotus japonicus]
MRNTDFSIARILSDDRGCSPKSRVDREEGGDVERKPRVPALPEAREGREGETRRSEERSDAVVPDVVETTGTFLVSGRPTRPEVRRADLTWLQYTRYRPPKLPRRSYVERRAKRRTDDRPRIPFSSSQLQVLEDRYRRSAYLSRNDVIEMSAMLRLPQSKIKIWFQNRRARQRRESLNSTIAAR